MQLLISKIKTAFRLGPKEFITVIIYKFLIRHSLHSVCKLESDIPSGPFFARSRLPKLDLLTVSKWDTSGTLFSYHDVSIDEPPKWLNNPITNKEAALKLEPWWKISDFDDSVGDIKLIWEQSRMNWAIVFAQRARNGDEGSLKRLNFWLSDWIKNNPPYLGHNWKCGQEASIRVMHLCVAALILGQEKDSLLGLQELIRLHLRRIAPTIQYAIAQNNNHGISEAAALFIGGSWLDVSGAQDGKKYEKLGRQWLDNRASKLIEEDGSFSQYSLNYHRMVLDTFSITEIWRKRLSKDSFSSMFYDRAIRASSWLYQMICPKSGHGPNLGANDGSHLLQLTECCYRDFRPSVQLASNLFEERLAYEDNGLWDNHLTWMGIENKKINPSKYQNCDYDSGGYKVLRSNAAHVIFRYPKFRFRPSQADAMHIDLWVNGKNLLTDAGSYSYNTNPDIFDYFNGTASHNTVQFDGRDQMPKLGRFLFGSWLKTEQVSPVRISDSLTSTSANYQDFKGVKHYRKVCINDYSLSTHDRINGFKKNAVIRWRLTKSQWILKNIKSGVEVSNGLYKLTVTSDVPILRADLSVGWKSLYYMQKEKIPVLEVEVGSAGSILSEFTWAK